MHHGNTCVTIVKDNVGDDLLADLQGEEGLIEGEGNAVGQTHATDSDDALALGQRELTRYGRVGCHNFFTDHAGRRFAAKGVHILHKSAQFCKLLEIHPKTGVSVLR
jgi:hypothetical protein